MRGNQIFVSSLLKNVFTYNSESDSESKLENFEELNYQKPLTYSQIRIMSESESEIETETKLRNLEEYLDQNLLISDKSHRKFDLFTETEEERGLQISTKDNEEIILQITEKLKQKKKQPKDLSKVVSSIFQK